MAKVAVSIAVGLLVLPFVVVLLGLGTSQTAFALPQPPGAARGEDAGAVALPAGGRASRSAEGGALAIQRAPLEASALLHGIAFSKGCVSPTLVGAPYTCAYAVKNDPTVNTSLDTLTFTGISDTVHASPADVSSGNILASLVVAAYNGGAGCVNGASVAVPVGGKGAVKCTLPSGGAVLFAPFSFYTTKAGDPSPLTDTALVAWQDLCDVTPTNCVPNPPPDAAASEVVLITSTPTNTPTRTPTSSPPASSTSTPINTPTRTPPASSTSTPTAPAPAPSSTPTRTASPTATRTATAPPGPSSPPPPAPTAPPTAIPTAVPSAVATPAPARGPGVLPVTLPRSGGPVAGALISVGLAALALGLRLARRRRPGP